MYVCNEAGDGALEGMVRRGDRKGTAKEKLTPVKAIGVVCVLQVRAVRSPQPTPNYSNN
jgi:hypothetical protein